MVPFFAICIRISCISGKMLVFDNRGHLGSAGGRKVIDDTRSSRHQCFLHGDETVFSQFDQTVFRITGFAETGGASPVELPIVYQIAPVGSGPGFQLCHIPIHGSHCMPYNHIDLYGIAARICRKGKGPFQPYEIRGGLFQDFAVQQMLCAVLIQVADPQQAASILCG
ncbi:unknown [Ruminococcus sp. CAG:60]|nr:unknown [Ruminococcus sp. CAG:60]